MSAAANESPESAVLIVETCNPVEAADALGGELADSGDDAVQGNIPEESAESGQNPDLRVYRDRTIALLRRYLRLAVEVGRLPSLLGREFFRTRITSYHTQTFEDTVVFVHDVESCLSLLHEFDRKLLAMIVLQEFSHEDTASLLCCTRRTIVRQFGEALDRISAIFLDREILWRLPEKKPNSAEACQEGKIDEIPASDSA